MRCLRLSLPLLLLMAGISPLQASTILLEDDFNDNSVDITKWSIVTSGIPFGSPSVKEQSQRMEIRGRGHLVTLDQFDPVTDGPLHVSGVWTFVQPTSGSGTDFMQILTRSDGVPGGAFGGTQNGIAFTFNSVAKRLGITRNVAGATTSLGQLPLDVSIGETFVFDITDDGTKIRFGVTEVGGDGTMGLLVANDPMSFASNHVVFHNRENNTLSFLDDVVIERVPEPSAFLLMVLGTGSLFFARRPRRKSTG